MLKNLLYPIRQFQQAVTVLSNVSLLTDKCSRFAILELLRPPRANANKALRSVALFSGHSWRQLAAGVRKTLSAGKENCGNETFVCVVQAGRRHCARVNRRAAEYIDISKSPTIFGSRDKPPSAASNERES